jgi:hypothetical protein
VDPLAGGDDDWDVAVVHLGSNYLGDRDAYEAELSGILERLAPRPTLLYTVTEYRPSWADVNEVIRGAAERFDHVSVVDWEEVARTPGVLSGDGLHPTTAGQEVLVELTASTLGSAPERDGDCLPTSFTDDSLIGRGDIPSTPNSASSGAYGTGTSGSDSSSSGDVVTQPPVTDPAPVTAAPPTTEAPPPATQPPPVTEAPPVTQPPPVTNPPATPPPTTLAP